MRGFINRIALRRFYLAAAAILFAIEIFIAAFVRDRFVRTYVGDVLALALVYVTLRAVTPLRGASALATALAIAVTIEVSQALHLLAALGLSGNRLARIVLGGVFDWADIAAYLAGVLIVAGGERAHASLKRRPN